MRIQKSARYGKISVSVGGAGLGFFRRFSTLVLILLLILPPVSYTHLPPPALLGRDGAAGGQHEDMLHRLSALPIQKYLHRTPLRKFLRQSAGQGRTVIPKRPHGTPAVYKRQV